jgi:hypothetical protein
VIGDASKVWVVVVVVVVVVVIVLMDVHDV